MTDRHEHLDEGTIHAWLDGALTPDESARVESAAESCGECAALVAEARGLVAASSRILSSLDAVPAGVIPGLGANVDQLAALRARRRATSRPWWQDRRVAVAASLVFVAGISSLVLRSDGGESMQSAQQFTAESTLSAPVVTPPPAPASAPAVTNPVVAREAPARDAKVAASPPPSTATVRERTADVRFDSLADSKVARASAPAVGAVANEARRSDTGSVGRVGADSIVTMRREVTTSERQLRQQGAPRQAVQQQFRVDSLQQAAASANALSAGLRQSIVTTGAGAAMADVAGPGGTCYRLRGLTAPAVADTIRLLNLSAPVLSDPSWFRTQIYGALRDTTLAWRSIDSVTVEVRARFGSDTTAVRFRTDGAASDSRDVPGGRSASAMRVSCPR